MYNLDPIRIIGLDFNFEIKPKSRPRLGLHGHVYTTKKTKQNETEIKLHAQSQLQEFAVSEKPFQVFIKFKFTQKKSNKTRLHTQRPDLDNMLKTLLDALNGVIWHDDSQVFSVTATKEWADKPGIEVVAYEFEGVRRPA
jgi:Holliday junction resolvase RusA-like endonuclease